MSACKAGVASFFVMKLILTADGSHTLELTDVGEHYHSTEGAIEEARHVYIRPCLQEALSHFSENTPLSVFEVGFGTGLNAMLTLLAAEQLQRQVAYTVVELHPLAAEVYDALNYPECLAVPRETFTQLHSAPWGERVSISPRFSIRKIQADVTRFDFPESPTFHAVYYDAFAPQYQPQLWTAELFESLSRSLYEGALLTTYCCKGDVKRALRAAGFQIQKLPGYGRKREMLRATFNNAAL